MSNQKVTRWFNPSVKPVHVGLYQTGWGDEKPRGEGSVSPFLWLWDGKYWRASDSNVIAPFQNRYWRGLAKQPKGV